MVAGDVAGVAAVDLAGRVGEGVPDRGSPAVLVDGTLDLVRGRRRAPQEPLGESHHVLLLCDRPLYRDGPVPRRFPQEVSRLEVVRSFNLWPYVPGSRGCCLTSSSASCGWSCSTMYHSRPRGVAGLEQAVPRHRALPDRGVGPLLVRCHVLEVEEVRRGPRTLASRPLRVLAREPRPVQVELQSHEPGIGLPREHLPHRRVPHRDELEVVVVVGEPGSPPARNASPSPFSSPRSARRPPRPRDARAP